MNTKSAEIINANSYAVFLNQVKEDIQKSQLRAAVSLTTELTSLYWRIGKGLIDKINLEGWGAKTIDRLAKDITASFSDASSFSRRNLYFMKQFASSYPEGICETAVSQLPWGHNIVLLQKLDDPIKRRWYAEATISNSWSRTMLIHWIESNLFSRTGQAITNFKDTLASPQSDLATQTLKDPYNFSFIALKETYEEKELEEALTTHIQNFLLELGQGFAFLGRQYKLEVSDKDFKIDLLFYHLKLRCYVIVDLKATEFDPRDVGQMSFYLSAVDDLLRDPQDNPSIGIILCKTKNRIVAEYALRNLNRPVGVSSYETQIIESLPDALKSSLPSIEEIEEELSRKTSQTMEKIEV